MDARPLARLFLPLALILPLAASADPPPRPSVDETRADEAALRAISDHWQEAEIGGDTRYLDELLAPEYRSVNAQGVATPKAKILARVQSQHDPARERQRVDDYRRAHPVVVSVLLHGTIGVVQYTNAARGPLAVRGADVFVYEHGRWHAMYSYHSLPDPPV